jgi:hypothetical protein
VDHHIKCVDRALRRIAAKGHDLRTECVSLSWLQEAILDEKFVPRIEKISRLPNATGVKALFYLRTDDPIPKTAVIIYDVTLELHEPERRFIVAKELSHIFDEPAQHTASPAQIDKLVSDLISSGVRTDAPTRADKDARMLAIEMLVPFDRRKPLLAGTVTSEVIQQLAIDCQIPLEWAQIALDPEYNTYIADIRRRAKIADLY